MAFHAELFFALLGDSSEAAAEGAAGECGADEPRSESLERPREKRDLNVRDADMGKEEADCVVREGRGGVVLRGEERERDLLL